MPFICKSPSDTSHVLHITNMARQGMDKLNVLHITNMARQGMDKLN